MPVWMENVAKMAAATLDMFSTLGNSQFTRKIGGINDQMTREQIRIQSEADAAQRVRATGNLISAQRSAIGASGVAGGRTARLIEARTRINSGREQMQADQGRRFAEAASRINRIQNRARARSEAWRAGGDMFISVASGGSV